MGKKLIEVPPFLPLDAISKAATADKDKKTGTIKNVHKWFAPMPTPALRALIFGAVVDAPDDPEEHARLLKLVERLVPPDGNPPDQKTLDEARDAIAKSTGGELPTIFDPFCGGGSTLVEAQRLGLPAIGSDLNPLAVLITRVLTDVVPSVRGAPARIDTEGTLDVGSKDGYSLEGFAADVRSVANQVAARARSKLADFFPEQLSSQTIVIAWIWTRDVRCENPACRRWTPLLSTLVLSARKGSEVCLDPSQTDDEVILTVREGDPTVPDPKVGRARFRCLACNHYCSESYVHDEIDAGRFRYRLCAIAEDLQGRRSYRSPSTEDIVAASRATRPDDLVEVACRGTFASNAQGRRYGYREVADYFTERQLCVLSAFADEVAAADDLLTGLDDRYRTAIGAVLALMVGKMAQANSKLVRWRLRSVNSKAEPAFATQGIPMVWDFAETNPFGSSVGSWSAQLDAVLSALDALPVTRESARVEQRDARTAALAGAAVAGPIVLITDPPYFNQIAYADLSDVFYLWHRRALRRFFPPLYSTIEVPKEHELISAPHRHDGNERVSRDYFISGFVEVFRGLRTLAKAHPIVIIYAHRQEEKARDGGMASTGWDAMLEAILTAGLAIESTLPIRGSSTTKMIGQGKNSLASYVAMVCRPRHLLANPGTLGDLRHGLRSALPDVVATLLGSGESMVDIRHAAIGPGIEVFSQFSAVYDGAHAIHVREALTIINEELGHLLDKNLGDVDDATRWACQWFVDHKYSDGPYDEARKLAQAFGLGVNGLVSAGLVQEGRGRVRLLERGELAAGWQGDSRTPRWEALQHLVKRLTEGATGGEEPAAKLLAVLGTKASGVRELAQYLTNVAIEKSWSDEAIAYDALVTSWPRIEELAAKVETSGGRLF